MIDFKVAEQSKLRKKGELTALFGVSFQMVSAYLKGTSHPRGKNRVRVEETLRVLSVLLEQKKLPFSIDKDRDFRKRAVEKIRAHVESKIAGTQ